jgi:hypothetical protein
MLNIRFEIVRVEKSEVVMFEGCLKFRHHDFEFCIP